MSERIKKNALRKTEPMTDEEIKKLQGQVMALGQAAISQNELIAELFRHSNELELLLQVVLSGQREILFKGSGVSKDQTRASQIAALAAAKEAFRKIASKSPAVPPDVIGGIWNGDVGPNEHSKN